MRILCLLHLQERQTPNQQPQAPYTQKLQRKAQTTFRYLRVVTRKHGEENSQTKIALPPQRTEREMMRPSGQGIHKES